MGSAASRAGDDRVRCSIFFLLLVTARMGEMLQGGWAGKFAVLLSELAGDAGRK